MWDVPLADGCATDLYSSHALEHVRKAQVIPTLREWYRLLAEDGQLIVRVPDLKWCVINWINTGCGNGWELDTIFGSQEHDGNVHRTGFTPEMLKFYLGQAGFVVLREGHIQSHGQPTIEMVCRKGGHNG
jgi:predicted SAM-dependent methyltransferase